MMYRALTREGDWNGQGVPSSVERQSRRYLAWGIMACGHFSGACSVRFTSWSAAGQIPSRRPVHVRLPYYTFVAHHCKLFQPSHWRWIFLRIRA